MPTYKLPDDLKSYGCRDWNGVPHLMFFLPKRSDNPYSYDAKVDVVRGYGGFELFGSALVPLLSNYVLGWNTPPLEDLLIKKVDLESKTVVVQRKKRTRELTSFPSNTHAVVIDTDLPVTDHFCDNLCSYTIGHWARKTEKAWYMRFFDELGVEEVPDGPYYKNRKCIWWDGFFSPCSPWPTIGYSCNGRNDIVNNITQKTLAGSAISKVLGRENRYLWPAYMSVALFFDKHLDDLRIEIIKRRAEQFCKSYPTEDGNFHCVTGYRFLDMDVFQFWRDWEEGNVTEWHHKNWIEMQRRPRHKGYADCKPVTPQVRKKPVLMLPPPKHNQPTGVCVQKAKVQIDEIIQEAGQELNSGTTNLRTLCTPDESGRFGLFFGG